MSHPRYPLFALVLTLFVVTLHAVSWEPCPFHTRTVTPKTLREGGSFGKWKDYADELARVKGLGENPLVQVSKLMDRVGRASDNFANHPLLGALFHQDSMEGEYAMCSLIPVPLNPTEEYNKIDIFVKRFPARSFPEKRGTLWLLEGDGGSYTAQSKESVLARNLWLLDYFDVVYIDHRGTYRSSPIKSCDHISMDPSQNGLAWMSECVNMIKNNYGEKGVDLFGADAVAGDISRISNIISSASLQSSQQSIYLLADSPSSKLVKGLIGTMAVEGIIYTGEDHNEGQPLCAASVHNHYYDITGRQLLRYCNLSTNCMELLGQDPVRFVADLYERMFGSTPTRNTRSISINNWRGRLPPVCQDLARGAKPHHLASVLGPLTQHISGGALVMELVFRFMRCTPDDVSIILSHLNKMKGLLLTLDKEGSGVPQSEASPFDIPHEVDMKSSLVTRTLLFQTAPMCLTRNVQHEYIEAPLFFGATTVGDEDNLGLASANELLSSSKTSHTARSVVLQSHSALHVFASPFCVREKVVSLLSKRDWIGENKDCLVEGVYFPSAMSVRGPGHAGAQHQREDTSIDPYRPEVREFVFGRDLSRKAYENVNEIIPGSVSFGMQGLVEVCRGETCYS